MDQSRRTFVKTTGLASTAALAGWPPDERRGRVPTDGTPILRVARTPYLDIGYEETGDPNGLPVFLLHGFPYDARAWDHVAPRLAAAGHRALVPYLRGYGPTRFRDPAAPRTAEQAAIGQDVLDMADALGLDRFTVCGYDWGNRAACIAAVLHPDRVRAIVSIGGYSIQDTVNPSQPGPPDQEADLWYQWYFNTERGRAGLQKNRKAICRYLWETWSPGWRFDDETYDRSAVSFDNPDFVDVVIHSYRHRHLNAPGEQRFLEVEAQLARRPPIAVPAIVLRGRDAALGAGPPPDDSADRAVFTSLIASRAIAGAGHCVPCEQPAPVAAAIEELLALKS